MIQVSKVKKIFNENDDFNRQIRLMAKRCKEGNVKRLTPSTYHIALGKLGEYLK